MKKKQGASKKLAQACAEIRAKQTATRVWLAHWRKRDKLKHAQTKRER